MKKSLTRGEILLFTSPLLFLAIAGMTWQRQQTLPFTVKLGEPYSIGSMSFSPDSQRLALFSTNLYCGIPQGAILDLPTRSMLCEINTQTYKPGMGPSSYDDGNWSVLEYTSPAWSSDGKRIASIVSPRNGFREKNWMAIFDADDGTLEASYTYPATVGVWNRESIRYSTDDATLILGGIPPARYDATTGKRLNRPDKNFNRKAFAIPDEKLGLLAVSDEQGNNLRVLDFKSKRVVWQPPIKSRPNYQWHEGVLGVPEMIGSGELRSGANHLVLWDGNTRRPLASPPVIKGSLTGFSFAPDKRTLFYFGGPTVIAGAASFQGDLVAWDYRANRELWRTAVPHILGNFQPSPDGKWLSCVTSDGAQITAYVFDSSGRIRLERAGVSNVTQWSPDSKQLAIIPIEYDKPLGKYYTFHIEIHRFEG